MKEIRVVVKTVGELKEALKTLGNDDTKLEFQEIGEPDDFYGSDGIELIYDEDKNVIIVDSNPLYPY